MDLSAHRAKQSPARQVCKQETEPAFMVQVSGRHFKPNSRPNGQVTLHGHYGSNKVTLQGHYGSNEDKMQTVASPGIIKEDGFKKVRTAGGLCVREKIKSQFEVQFSFAQRNTRTNTPAV